MLTVDPKLLNLEPGDWVLDLGCGEGRHIHNFYYFNDVHAVGIDLNLEDLLTAHKKLVDFPGPSQGAKNRSYTLAVADALRLPFPDCSFDKVVCSEVLEHIPSHQTVIAEIARILKPGGTLVASVPRFYPEWICWKLSVEYRHEPGGHVRIFTSRQLKRDIEQAGFTRFKRHWAHGLHSPYWWLRCMVYKTADQNPLVKVYHRLLVWDILKRPLLTRTLETLTAPIMGKSVVMYFTRQS